jgi:hypothetical protein
MINRARGSDSLGRLQYWLNKPVDASSVIFFRVCFGLVMAGWAWNYLSTGMVSRLYIRPEFHFPYWGFEWVKPLPGDWMYAPFVALALLGLMIAVGCWYRISAMLFAVTMTYVFLLERTNYQNHYYLICLVSWCLPLLPLNRLVSVDVWQQRVQERAWVPRWVLGLLQFHVGITYLYGGIAKLTPDWMLGQPMGIYLATKSSWPVVGSWFADENAGVLFSYGGLLFDLLIVPFLIWKKTRVLAFLGCAMFHLSNALLFQIHIFPWFMIAATTLFFDPSWVRRVLASGNSEATLKIADFEPIARLSLREKAFASLLLFYMGFQVVWPLRSRLFAEETSWTERGHLFSWRMMLRTKEVGLGYAIRNPKTGEVSNANHVKYLDEEQAEKFGRDPINIVSLAKFLADQWEKENGVRPEVYAFVAASLNGRKPQLMIDPNLDLASLSRKEIFERTFVMPLKEPLRSPAWDIPVAQWKEHMEIPELSFMKKKSN